MTGINESTESIFGRLIELSIKQPRITLNLLKEHNLANNTALMALFEELDTITVSEAISVCPERLEQQKIWRRKRNITCQVDRFTPSMLLTDHKKYYMILKARDEYISREDALKQMGICYETLRRFLKSRNISLPNNGRYINMSVYKVIVDYYSKPNRVSLEEIQSSLGIKKSSIFFLAKQLGISFAKWSVTQDEFIKIKERRNELLVKRSLTILKDNRIFAQGQF